MAGQRLFSWPFSAIPVWSVLRSPLFTAILLSTFVSLVNAAQETNFTLQVPDGTTNHGDPSLLCVPTKWTDVLIFLAGNYLAHALTVVPKPGEPSRDVVLRTIVALLFPNYGMRDGLDSIFSHAMFVKDPLQRAARASALCMVVRSPLWKPRVGDSVQGVEFSGGQLQELQAHAFSESESVSQKGSHENEDDEPHEAEISGSNESRGNAVHRRLSLATAFTVCDGDTLGHSSEFPSKRGLSTTTTLDPIARVCSKHELPELTYSGFYSGDPIQKGCLHKIPTKWEVNGSVEIGPEYTLVLVPQDAKVQPITSAEVTRLDDVTRYPATLSAHYTLAKAVIAIFQTLYSSITLFQTRGDQINQYGYASFGLTVAPYTVMSLVNLIGNLCTPDYSALQLVGSPTLDESLCRGNKVNAAIGRLAEEPTDTTSWTGTFCDVDHEVELYVVRFTQDSAPDPAEPFTALIRIHRPPKQPPTLNRIDKPYNPNPPKPQPETFLSHPSLPRLPRRSLLAKQWVRAILILTVMVAPVCINAAISHFQPGQSTIAQRLWTVSWLVVGSVGRLGSMYGPLKEHLYMEDVLGAEDSFWNVATLTLCLLIFGMPVFGGLAVVVQMLVTYGSCTRFD